jgi:hypothetical protein
MRQASTKSPSPHQPAAPPARRAPAVDRPAGLPLWSAEGPVQFSLRVNRPGDAYEQQAERMADQVMRSPGPEAPNQRGSCACGRPMGPDGMCEECKRKQQAKIQRMPAGSRPAGPQTTAPAAVNQVISQPGRPLDSPTRHFMESRFSTDFSHVRAHHDPQAARSAEQINARAYTAGNHIVFGPGQYNPHNSSGQRLIAHELAHVIQQNRGVAPLVQRYTEAEIEECPCLDWTLVRMHAYAQSMVLGGSLSGRGYASDFMDQFLEEDTSDAFVPFADVQADTGGQSAINVVTNRLINQFVQAGEGLECDTPTRISRSASAPGHFAHGTDLFYAMGAFNIRASGTATVTKTCYDGECSYIEIEVNINYRIDDLYDWKVDPGGCTPATGEDGCAANMKQVNLPVLGQICDECLNRLVIAGWAAEFMVKVRGTAEGYYDMVDCGHRYADEDVTPRPEER